MEDIKICAYGWGCGFCGTVGPPAPMCCAKGREWCLRLARQLRDEADLGDELYKWHASGEAAPSFMDKHDAARWQRVVRRWEQKRVG